MSGNLKDMARTSQDVAGACVSPTMLGEDKYPYGLRINLCENELEKLGVDHTDWEIGDTFHLHALAKVVSISQNASEEKESINISLQLTHLAGPESEEAEDEEEEHEDGEEKPSEKSRYLQYDE